MNFKKILIIRFSSIGDVIIATSFSRSLKERFPKSDIHFLTKSNYSQLLLNNPSISKLKRFEPTSKSIFSLYKNLRKENYCAVIDLSSNFRSKLLTLLLSFSTKKIFTYKKHSIHRRLFVRFHRLLPRNSIPIYKRYLRCIEILGVQPFKGYEVFTSKVDEEKVVSLLAKRVENARGIVVFATSATYTTKKWPTKYFIALAKKLNEDFNIILIGGRSEVSQNREIKKGAKNIVDLTDRLTLIQTASLFKHSSIVVAHDSGMMHLAQSQNCPTVAIFGSTTRHFGFFPINSNCKVIEADLPCRPCCVHGRAVCPLGHFDCMRKIEAKRVEKAVRELL